MKKSFKEIYNNYYNINLISQMFEFISKSKELKLKLNEPEKYILKKYCQITIKTNDDGFFNFLTEKLKIQKKK